MRLAGAIRRIVLLALLLMATAIPIAQAQAAPARASLPAIERQVMCVTCKIPLNVAQSPQADRERTFIQGLIDRGEDEAAIKHALVERAAGRTRRDAVHEQGDHTGAGQRREDRQQAASHFLEG